MTDRTGEESLALTLSRRLDALLRREAETQGGRLPFDRFMELALYAPGLGYYTGGAQKFGPEGDFITAPLLSPLFGRTLARQCAQVLEVLTGGEILELGAGTGDLAVDLLEGLGAEAQLPERYLILETSAELRARQQVNIAQRAPHLLEKVHWLDGLPAHFRGLILGNEVADALPVHRFCIGEKGQVLEVFARPLPESWEDVLDQPISPGLEKSVQALQAQGLAREQGYCSEINLRLAPWIRALSESLAQGMILLIDYGYPRAAYYHPSRSRGTLLCHARHQAHENPYLHPGLQDISAQVDFSALADAGRSAELHLAGFTTQAHFLLGCGLDEYLSEAIAANRDPNLLLRAKQLLLPTGMGERFQVIAFTRGLAPDRIWQGFSLRDLRGRLG